MLSQEIMLSQEEGLAPAFLLNKGGLDSIK